MPLCPRRRYRILHRVAFARVVGGLGRNTRAGYTKYKCESERREVSTIKSRESSFASAVELTRRIAVSVIALFLVGLFGIGVMTVMAARGRDADARDASWANAIAALGVASDRLAEVVTDYGHWDEVNRPGFAGGSNS
jgi:hypothetical protein